MAKERRKVRTDRAVYLVDDNTKTYTFLERNLSGRVFRGKRIQKTRKASTAIPGYSRTVKARSSGYKTAIE